MLCKLIECAWQLRRYVDIEVNINGSESELLDDSTILYIESREIGIHQTKFRI